MCWSTNAKNIVEASTSVDQSGSIGYITIQHPLGPTLFHLFTFYSVPLDRFRKLDLTFNADALLFMILVVIPAHTRIQLSDNVLRYQHDLPGPGCLRRRRSQPAIYIYIDKKIRGGRKILLL
jgi:hypothetical protein